MKKFVIFSLAAFFGSAMATSVKVSLPEGLTPGQNNTVQVIVDNDSQKSTKNFSLLFEGGQNGADAVRQIDLTSPLVQITPKTDGVYRVGIRYSENGKNYGQVAEIRVPSPATDLNFEFKDPNTRASVPLLQFFLWIVLAAVLGLIGFGRRPANA